MNTMQFKNATDIGIIVSSWITVMPGLGEYIDVIVPPQTEVTVKSDVGEWILGSLFYDKDYAEQWKAAGLSCDSRLAKFRSEPCYRGDYTWNFIDDIFDLCYKDGIVIWSKK